MLNHLLIQEGATHPLIRADLPPTREVPTPHYTIPRYTTPPPPATHPSTPATRRLKGADPYSAKRIYMPTLRTCGWTYVLVNGERVCEGENFETKGEFMASRGSISLLGPLPALLQGGAHLLQISSREFLSEVPAREVVLLALPRRHRLLRSVAADWTMHGYMHDASPFAIPVPAVQTPRFYFLFNHHEKNVRCCNYRLTCYKFKIIQHVLLVNEPFV